MLAVIYIDIIHFYSPTKIKQNDLKSHADEHNNKYSKSTRTISLTTRLDINTMRELEDEANSTGIAISSLTKQILTNYARWDKFVSKAGMIPVAKGVISEAFDKLSEDDVVRLATSVGKNALRDIIVFMKGKVDLDSLFSWLELWLKRNSTAGFSYVIENGLHTCIMNQASFSIQPMLLLSSLFHDGCSILFVYESLISWSLRYT